jgi:hypothetical protein
MVVLFDVEGKDFLVLLNRRVVVIASNQPLDVKKLRQDFVQLHSNEFRLWERQRKKV